MGQLERTQETWTAEQMRIYWATGKEPKDQTVTPLLIESEWKDKTENVLQATIINIATKAGWEYYHTHNSKNSPEGWPDLVLARMDEEGNNPEVIMAELKRIGQQPTPKQLWWLQVLQLAGIEAYLWSPMDLPFIEERLTK